MKIASCEGPRQAILGLGPGLEGEGAREGERGTGVVNLDSGWRAMEVNQSKMDGRLRESGWQQECLGSGQWAVRESGLFQVAGFVE